MKKPNDSNPERKTVLVTGVSTGIGYATAERLISAGYRVLGNVRKTEDADRCQEAFGEAFTPLLFDLTDEDAVRRHAVRLPELTGEQGLAALINNAGISLPGPLAHLDLHDIRHLFEVNVFGLIHLTQQCLPFLGADRTRCSPPGRIINISSTGGRIVHPFIGAYCASKFALEAFSDALRRELFIYDIPVIVIEPDATKTPIWTKTQHRLSAFRHTDYAPYFPGASSSSEPPAPAGRDPGDIAEVIVRALCAPHPKARYAVLNSRFRYWLLPRLLPDRWYDLLVQRRLRKRAS